MKKINFKALLPHVIAVGIFLVVSLIYCKPVLQGKVLRQHDTQSWKGMAQQSFDVKEKTGRFPLWTNSMFSGMPTFQIAMDANIDISKGFEIINTVFSLGLPDPVRFFFLACLCFYIMCITLKVNPWLSILGAIAYAYSTYNPIIIVAGHNTKMMSMALYPMIFAGMFLLYERKYLLGFTVTAFFSSTLIGQNHLQIVYYTLLVVMLMSIAYIITSYQQKNLKHALKASVLGLIAGVIGLGTTAAGVLPTYDYSKETMRGGVSQVTLNKDTANKTKGGLDKDYALRWSLGKMETFTIMVPGLYGGSNGGNEHSSSAAFVEKMGELGVPEENALGMANGYSYWGSMSSLSETTSGPVYMGAMMCFLFIFGLVYLNSWHKWWIIAATVTGILLAWGSNFSAFNYFMLDHLPFYGKFRAPSMAMIIVQFCLPLLGVLTLNKLVAKETDLMYAWKKLKQGVIATGAILILLTGFYFTAGYIGKGDKQIADNFKHSILSQAPANQPVPEQLQQQADNTAKDIMKALRTDRKSLAGKDLLRTVLFIGIAVLLTGLFIKKKVPLLVLLISFIILTGIDLFTINARYLYADRYEEAESLQNDFTPTQTDLAILKDPDHANFRVFNQSGSFTNEAQTSYLHNSIGGYHAAKLGLYQDLIEYQIGKGNMQVLNMLNTKYFITPGQDGKPASAQINPGAFGSCWLVKGIKFVSSPNEEMLALDVPI
jgi:hypothetical protein